MSDPHTGDNKHQEETLANGVVHGSYSLTEPDGTIRKVTYTADKINGMQFKTIQKNHEPRKTRKSKPTFLLKIAYHPTFP